MNKKTLLALVSVLTVFTSPLIAISCPSTDVVFQPSKLGTGETKIMSIPSTWSWSTTYVVSTESTDDSYGSNLVVDEAGNVHVVWLDYTDYSGAGTDADIFYKRWTAANSSWSTTQVVSTESTEYSYFPSLAVDEAGNVHIAWEDYTDYSEAGTDADIFYSR